VADVSTHWSRRSYPAVDAADTQSCRPDFAIALYPGHMREHTIREFELNPTLPVSRDTPPTFLLQAVDDPVDPVENSLVYFLASRRPGFRWSSTCMRTAAMRSGYDGRRRDHPLAGIGGDVVGDDRMTSGRMR